MSNTKVISYDMRLRAFWSLVAVAVVLVAVYIYAIARTTQNTVARKQLEGEIATLTLKNADLEFAYITERNNLDLTLAQAHGLQENTEPIYLSRTTTEALSLNRISR